MTDVAELPRDVCAPAQARALLDRFASHVDRDVLADAKLLVSELITNSVRYGSDGSVALLVEVAGPRHLQVEVVDHGAAFEPPVRARDRTEPGGWGLQLVGQIADRWGTRSGSAHVWFEIDRS